MSGPRTAITRLVAVGRLDAIDASDPERAHAEADAVLLAAVPDLVRAHYEFVAKRANWWASA